jgi:hypothetical protein
MLKKLVCVAFAFCLGRTYSLTLLWNLNSRRQPRREVRSSGSGVAFRLGQSTTRSDDVDMKPTARSVQTARVDCDEQDATAALHRDDSNA